MSKAHICFCCHLVRGCNGCCHICKRRCNMIHDCEIHDRHMSENQGWEWYMNVTAAIDKDGEFAMKAVPDIIRSIVKKQTSKPRQLLFEFDK